MPAKTKTEACNLLPILSKDSEKMNESVAEQAADSQTDHEKYDAL